MPKQELTLHTTFHIILEAYIYSKKQEELRYWEFAMKIQNGARKAAVEDTAILMATIILCTKSTEEEVISADEYSISPLPPSDTSVTNSGRTLLNPELGTLLIYSVNTRRGFIQL